MKKNNGTIKLNNINENFESQVELLNIMFNSIIESDDLSIEFKKSCLNFLYCYVLLHILKCNKNLKRISDKYEELKVKLSLEVNKYSKIQKLLRSNKYYISCIISNEEDSLSNRTDLFSFNNLTIISNESSNFIDINRYLENFDLLGILNSSEKYQKNRVRNQIIFPNEIIDVDKKVKSVFENIKERELSEREYTFVSNIIEKSKSMYSLFFITKSLNNILNINLSEIKISEDILSFLEIFISECNEKYSLYKNKLNDAIESLNCLVEEYCANFSVNETKNLVLPSKLVDKYNQLNKLYFEDKDFKYSFLTFLNENYPEEKDIIAYEENKNNQAMTLYSEYLIYKISIPSNEKMLSFDEYVKDKYGINPIGINVKKS